MGVTTSTNSAATYEPIATTTLGSSNTDVTFSSIPSTYTDLRLIFTGKAVTTGTDIGLIFNSNSSSLCSSTKLIGNGSAASSSRLTNVTPDIRFSPVNGLSSVNPAVIIFDIFSYAGSTYKTVLAKISQDLNGSGTSELAVGLWRSTSAINTVGVSTTGNASYSFAAGSTFTLYGIKAA